MKFLCLLALVLVATHVVAEDEEPEPGSQVGVSCSSFAALKIRVRGRGRCKGTAGADCLALASSENAFREAYNVWWADGEKCDKVKLEEAAQAVAHACAAVYTKTIAQVSCQGRGFACGWSISEGSAYAVALAKALAQAAVDAGGVDTSAFCVADVEAVSGAVAEAAASSESKACVTGTGSEKDFQDAFVESIAEAIAEAFVTATAATCDEEGAAAAKSLCKGEAAADVKTEVKAEASEKSKAKGRAGLIEDCLPGLDDCCDPKYRRAICTSSDPDTVGTWYKASEYRSGHDRTWRHAGTRETCACIPPKA